MSDYLPEPATRFLNSTLLLVLIALLGLTISRLKLKPMARIFAWGLVILSTVLAISITGAAGSVFKMLIICAALLQAMKHLVLVEYAITTEHRLNLHQWCAFNFLWFGMNPQAFWRWTVCPLHFSAESKRVLAQGCMCVLCGLALIVCASIALRNTGNAFIATCLLLPGLSLTLHFGIFDILTGLWQGLGAKVGILFRRPWLATSLTEFWGQRWNLAFVEMTTIALFRPLQRKLGPNTAIMMSFFLSGILHELAISVPVNAGYGLPLSYFMLQGVLILLEKNFKRNDCGWVVTLKTMAEAVMLAGNPVLDNDAQGSPSRRADSLGRFAIAHSTAPNRITGRIWTFFWIFAPMPLVFHPPFVQGVLLPLIHF